MPASAEEAWAPGPLRPQLADGAVHVWRADLATVADDLADLLCEQERARAKRIVSESGGALWTRSRGLLRALLGRYLQQEPGSLRFATGAHGKPTLIDGASTELAFNMSHSGHVALYAFSATSAVGVDVELGRRSVDEVAIARRSLGAVQARELEGLEPAIRQREFLRAWARHEAQLKCLGIGIGANTQKLTPHEPWVLDLEPFPDVAGAVAAERPALELRCWSWRQ
ncbi:MAG: phosphopantetheinyltransferase family protein [Solirubrobacterales bacterium]|nr:phosphopantetheinyltransferase family protein [Solirubrobacterales bacterium]